MKFLKIFAFLFVLTNLSFSQFTEFHPELNWYTIKGKHCRVHFHEGAERTAYIVAKISDEVWDPITSLYGYEPDGVDFVIKDIDDYSNGATYFFDNKIEIWTSALDFDLRGTHNWLRNVISHEFTHLVQIQSSLKASRKVPAVFLQMMNYEEEKRPDILYGFPNVIASYPLAGINVPSWFAEGTAQYMRKDFNYDNWDSHRDMILRSYALGNNMLSWNEMGVFGKTSLGNESVYNAGFALTRYISQKYGEQKISDISHALGKFKNFTMDAAIKDVLGISGNDLYNEWSSYLKKDYKTRIAPVLNNKVEGTKIADEGFGNFYPRFSPDGSKVYYISNKKGDYFAPSSIYEYDLATKKEKEVVPLVRSTFDFIPGTNKILYAKISDDNKNYYNVHDLYVYDISTEKETRLTYNLRANQPAISHDGTLITFIFEKDGTTNIGLVDGEGKNFKQMTPFANGEQVYNPRFSNDDSLIVFDVSTKNDRNIAYTGTKEYKYGFFTADSSDNRNPVFDKNGMMIYSSDKSGIFNLYSYNTSTKEQKQLSNVVGGAYMADINKNGDIVYSGYTSTGFKIFYLKNSELKEISQKDLYIKAPNPPLNEDKPKGDIGKFNLESLRNYNDFVKPDYQKSKYTGAFSNIAFYPFIRFDNYNTSNKFLEKLKPGVYLSSSDMLNRYSIYFGGSINSRLERDLFFNFEYRNKLPLLFNMGIKPELSLELYSISRKANSDILFNVDSTFTPPKPEFTIPTEITYNLFEMDIAAKHRLLVRGSDIECRYIYSKYSADIASFTLPDEDRTLYPQTNDVYLIGSNIQVKYSYEMFNVDRNDDINPVGFKGEIQYNYEMNKFNNEGNYTVEDGVLQPKYNNFDFQRLELNTLSSFPFFFKDHTISLKLRAATIFGPTMPDFFDYYLGGLLGMKAYPFYAVSGNNIGWLNLTYRFPLFQDIDTRIGHLYVDKLFMSVYGDAGNAWNGDNHLLKDVKKGIGTELRLQMTSFYIFPTAIFFDAAYGFDKVDRTVKDKIVSYGKEWRLYGGILFSFDY